MSCLRNYCLLVRLSFVVQKVQWAQSDIGENPMTPWKQIIKKRHILAEEIIYIISYESITRITVISVSLGAKVKTRYSRGHRDIYMVKTVT